MQVALATLPAPSTSAPPEVLSREQSVADAAAALGFDGTAARRLLEALRGAHDRAPHFGPHALIDSVASGAIAAVSGRWIVKQTGIGNVLRRQNLTAEAFVPVSELRRLVAALGDDYYLLFVALS